MSERPGWLRRQGIPGDGPLTGGIPSYGFRFYGKVVAGVFALMVMAAIALAATLLFGEGPPLWFSLIWFGVLMFNGYFMLWKAAFHLELAGDVLRWRTVFRHGAVNVSEITELRPSRLTGCEVIAKVDGTEVFVLVHQGLSAFAEALVKVRPDLLVRFGPRSRLSKRFGVLSWFRRI